MASRRLLFSALIALFVAAYGVSAQVCVGCLAQRVVVIEPGFRGVPPHVCRWKLMEITPPPVTSPGTSVSVGLNAAGEYAFCSTLAANAVLWGNSEAESHQTNVHSHEGAAGAKAYRVFDTFVQCVCHTIPLVQETISFQVSASMKLHPQASQASSSSINATTDWLAAISGAHALANVQLTQQAGSGTTGSISVSGGVGPVSAGVGIGGVTYTQNPPPYLQFVQCQDAKPAPGAGQEFITGMSSIAMQNTITFGGAAAVPAGKRSRIDARLDGYVAYFKVAYACSVCGAQGAFEETNSD